MNKVFLILLFAFLISTSLLTTAIAQIDDYTKYFESTIKAREYYDQLDCQAAYEATERAFAFVAHPAWRDLKKGLEIAICLKDSALIKGYCRSMAEIYGLLPGPEVFNDSSLYFYFQNAFAVEIVTAVGNFDMEYILILDSLAQEDQKIRRHGPVVYTDNINSDSLRTIRLLNLIDNKGFPQQSKVGMRGYRNAMLIFLHADFDLQNELLGVLMLENVMNGNMNPHDYAGIIDRRCNFRGEPLIYYQAPIGYENLSEEEKEQVTQRRRRIGLRSVNDSMSIEVLPGGDVRAIYKY